MPTLYVTEPNATVRFSGGSLHVTAAHENGNKESAPRLLLKVEPHRLESMALVGRVHVTVDALHGCLENGIGVVWFAWNGRLLGRMVPEMARCGDLRLMQYRMMENPNMTLSLARSVIGAKCANAFSILRGIQSNQPGLEDLGSALRELNIQRERIVACQDQESLLGHEGSAAGHYFAVLGHGFRGEIGFSKRVRRPPPDPANALLSFGYVLLGSRLAGYLEARGLDPSLGFFHAPRSGRASLSLDLLEEFRHAVVDRFVMRVCNLRMIQPRMFEPDPEQEGGVRLTREGLKAFFYAWGEYLERPMRDVEGENLSPLALMRRQVNRLAMFLRGEAPYQPFLIKD
ncbi:MAG: CRISPR-associated endonuclease Cas1 [Magnetococcales bacterium]|nr:CRISPR-associated endonuclease Cas1 [Magnetococcales bacterium]